MITNIELSNFRRHEHLKLILTNGLNVVRGRNEGGKSTIIEGVLYALYGSKALRTPLTETVTWGKAEKDLRVSVTINVGGVDYTFTRSKNGAECNSVKGKVAGQAEVSSYAADLLGADAKTASVLMLASQNGLRGALDEGPAAVSGLMSRLADFDTIDQLLEAASQRLLTGSDAPIKAKLEAARGNLEEARARVPDPALLADRAANLKLVEAELQAARKHAEDVLQPKLVEVNERLTRAKNHNASCVRARDLVAALMQDVASEEGRLAAATIEAADRPDETELRLIQEAAQKEKDHDKLVMIYRAFCTLPDPPAEVWEGDRAGFEATMLSISQRIVDANGAVAALESSVRLAKSKLITSGKCPTCGHAAHSDEHVAQHNAKVQEEVSSFTPPLTNAKALVQELTSQHRSLAAVASADRRLMQALAGIPAELVTVHTDTIPPRVTWNGDAPGPKVNVAGKALEAAQARLAKAQRAEGQATAYRSALARLNVELDGARKAAACLTPVDLEPIEAAHDAAYREYAECSQKVRDLAEAYEEARDALQAAQQDAQVSADKIKSLETWIAEYEEDLRKLAFNNTLVAKLKKLRPAITDHLWNCVLSAVSTFFTQMRGEKSVVTKDKDGFKVNGQSVDSLSGSTLDVLALAIRVALTKTFIPHASLLCLDEPAAGCDSSRTGMLLGFLSGVGFQQVLLASHDDLSESVADNLINLGV